jgi:hypothetical protein
MSYGMKSAPEASAGQYDGFVFFGVLSRSFVSAMAIIVAPFIITN